MKESVEVPDVSALPQFLTQTQLAPCRRDEINSDDDTQGVLIRNATKSFGVGRFRCTVLERLNMTVKKGSIYGLLGASGCGKTTLLSCIVGRRSLDSGNILVLGGEPGSEDSGIPGPRVGYMPQELALYGDFTIQETFQYFGRIYKLPEDFTLSQMEFLCNLLDLPGGSRFIKSLSGGQQRRVSFAVALFHEPELLILDEPTVGVDPLLRRSIWKYLVQQSVDHGRTVIITTHYIEEARQADAVGMMRSGRLLAEDLPQNLLKDYGLLSLENVFLKLCIKDGIEKKRDEENGKCSENQAESGSNTVCLNSRNIETDSKKNLDKSAIGLAIYRKTITTETGTLEASNGQCKNNRRIGMCSMPSWHRCIAIIRKNLMHTFRNIWMFAFVILLPVVQTVIFSAAIGHAPTSLKMAIVNDELNPSQGRICNYTTDCPKSMLSCRYLQFIDNTTIIQVPYESFLDALDAAKHGKVWGVVYIGKNFTDELVARQVNSVTVTKETIIQSQIEVTMDFSNQQIALFLQQGLLNAFEDFATDILKACDYNPFSATTPVTFLDPVYGHTNSAYTEFMAPGVIMTSLYFMAVALTTGVFIVERKSGLLDRSLVAGVRMSEILLAHLVNQFTVLICQTALVFIYMLCVFKIICEGSLTLAVFITLLQGLCGMSYGLLVSSLCDSEISAIQLSLGSFFPTLVLSGVVWPIEGISTYLRYLSYALPQTYAIEALRSIFARGWGIELPDIYCGILISLAWIFIMLALSVLVVRIRKHTG